MDELLLAFCAAILANLIELPIIWWFSRPGRLLARLSDPSEADRQSIDLFFDMMLARLVTPSIRTGEKERIEVRPAVVDEAGKVVKEAVFKEQDEIVSVMDIAIEKISDKVMQKFRGLQGSLTRDAQKLGMLPRKGQSNFEFLMQQGIERIMPKIEDSLAAKIEGILGKKGFT